ncbi:MAG: nucleotidyltransferase domain-containing protein [Pyrinomonadaceae bacterium]
MLDVTQYKEKVAKLCVKYGIRRLEFFGSVLSPDFDEESDIDCLIEFSSDPGNHFDRYFDLKYELEEVFGREVDLVVDTAITNPYFRQAVDNSRKLIYAA